jgi:eukaryotic-like serine/threonine-protein kinase
MDTVTESPLFTAFRDGGRIPVDQVSTVERAFADVGNDPEQLAEQLLAAGCLTRYQYRKIQLNRSADLLFGPYLVLERVGEGGMGKVYRAVRVPTAQMVALKTIRPNLLQNKTVISRYKREARAAAALDHPNIVKLFEADDIDGRYYMAMEFIEGMDLSRLTKELTKDKRSILPSEAAEYVRQAALGLQHAHTKGLVHRDIKPSNLLVSGERALPGTEGTASVKLLDMGLVRSLTEEDNSQMDLTRDGTVVGTPDYMSPEQAKNSSTVDHRADIYSLGCTLFYLLKGSPPFHEGTAIDKLIRHQLDPVPDIRQYRPDVPVGLAAVIRKMMAKKPNDRYQSGDETAKELSLYTQEAARFDFICETTRQYEHVDLSPPVAEPRSSDSLSTAPLPPTESAEPAEPATTPPARPTSGTTTRTVRPLSVPPSGQPSSRNPGVRSKAIARPVADASPSDSLAGTEVRPSKNGNRGDTPMNTPRPRKGRRVSKKKTAEFPVVTVAIGSAIIIALLVVAAIFTSRTSSSTTPTTPPIPATQPASGS